MRDLSSLTEDLLSAATEAGADAADAIAVHGTAISIDVRDGALEQAERAEGIEIGLRVLLGQRQAIVSASDTSAGTITAMAERAVAMAKEAPEDPYLGLAAPEDLARDWDVAKLDLADAADEPDPAALEDRARRAEAAARAVPGITKMDATASSYGRQALHLAATNGFAGGYERTSQSLSCVAITGDGTEMERDYYGSFRVYGADLESPEDVGRIAGERTAARAGARKPPTGAFPVIYDERISGGLIGHLTQAINGAAVARGASWLRDALGERVLPAGMTLTEDPLRPRVTNSRPFDAEGLASRARDIVKDGVLTGWVLDLGSARQLGLDSTANASRGASSGPRPGLSNLALTQGDKSKAELMTEIGTGLLVTSMIGASINPTTGDYSRGASGFWIENGEIAYPVNECTLAGNLRDMLKTIVPANDARPYLSRVIPSLLVEGLTLAGD